MSGYNWEHPQTVLRIESQKYEPGRCVEHENRYYICSLAVDRLKPEDWLFRSVTLRAEQTRTTPWKAVLRTQISQSCAFGYLAMRLRCPRSPRLADRAPAPAAPGTMERTWAFTEER
jgi:hypothetical protein